MILLLFACAAEDPAPEAAAPAFSPDEGPWMVSWAETYGGDCVLADMSTGQPESIEWTLELEANGFTLYDEYDYPVGCDLTGSDFACSLGTYHVGWEESGYDATEYVTTTITGTFADERRFDGVYAIHAACEGADCAAIGTQYGPEFAYDCTAEASLGGERI